MTTDTTDRLPSRPDIRNRRAPIDREPTTGSLSGAANMVGRTAGAWAAQVNTAFHARPHRYRILAGITLALATAAAIRGGTRVPSSNGPHS